MATLKNANSESKGTFDKIQKVLSTHGANKIMYDYKRDGSGKLEAITFAIQINNQDVGFRLPAMADNVYKIMYGGEDRYGREKEVTTAKVEQAYRTAWANIRDWIDAQMALIDTEQVKVEQVFLPYMIMKDGHTLYEQIERKGFELGDGKTHG